MKYTRKQIQNIRRNLENTCEFMTNWGVFRVNKAESLEHNLAMARQFTILSYEGFAVAVRPKLKNGNIPDLMILDTPKPIIKEVMITENDKRFAEKNYLGINKIKVNMQGELNKKCQQQ